MRTRPSALKTSGDSAAHGAREWSCFLIIELLCIIQNQKSRLHYPAMSRA